MKSAGWYFKKGAQKVYAASLAEAKRLAQAFADGSGRKVAVGYDAPAAARPKKAKPRKIAARRNPDPLSYIHVLEQQEKHKAARRAFGQATKAKRLAKAMRGGRGRSAEAAKEKTGKFVVKARNRRDSLTLYRPSRRQADDLAREFIAAGYTVTVNEA